MITTPKESVHDRCKDAPDSQRGVSRGSKPSTSSHIKSSRMTERQKKKLKPGDYELMKLRHQNTYRHMKYSGLQNVTLQNFARKDQ